LIISIEEELLRQTIFAENAPNAIGPYSHAVRAGGLLFLSGQIPLDPATNELVAGGVAEQTERVLENLKAILEVAESSLDRVVKTTVFLKNINDFAVMNEVYARYFPSDPPARSTVEVARLPQDARVEIDVVALG